MKKFFKRFVKEMYGLAWTLAGTGLVLITLSGSTRDWGVVISVAALIIHIFALFVVPEDEL
jgi:hypothetical protein